MSRPPPVHSVSPHRQRLRDDASGRFSACLNRLLPLLSAVVVVRLLSFADTTFRSAFVARTASYSSVLRPIRAQRSAVRAAGGVLPRLARPWAFDSTLSG